MSVRIARSAPRLSKAPASAFSFVQNILVRCVVSSVVIVVIQCNWHYLPANCVLALKIWSGLCELLSSCHHNLVCIVHLIVSTIYLNSFCSPLFTAVWKSRTNLSTHPPLSSRSIDDVNAATRFSFILIDLACIALACRPATCNGGNPTNELSHFFVCRKQMNARLCRLCLCCMLNPPNTPNQAWSCWCGRLCCYHFISQLVSVDTNVKCLDAPLPCLFVPNILRLFGLFPVVFVV